MSDLLQKPRNTVKLCDAGPADREDIFLWRNDPQTRQSSKTSDAIDWETHATWYTRALHSPDRRIYIGSAPDGKVGMVRFDRLSETPAAHLVSIMIAPHRRGQGWGKALLAAGLALDESLIYRAEIAANNHASLRIFEACGFERADDGHGPLLQFKRLPKQRT